MPREPPVTIATLPFNVSMARSYVSSANRSHRYNSARPMRDVAIIGAGELGGTLAHIAGASRRARRRSAWSTTPGRWPPARRSTSRRPRRSRGSRRASAVTPIWRAPLAARVVVLADRVARRRVAGRRRAAAVEAAAERARARASCCAGAAQRELVERGVVRAGLRARASCSARRPKRSLARCARSSRSKPTARRATWR